MYTARIMSNKRKGMASILGTLIFIGILFSAIVPMTIMMKQADLFYTQEVYNTETLDAEKADETVVVTSYPDASDMITVKVYNKGNVPINIIRVWINNDIHEENTPIASTEMGTFGSYTVVLGESNFDVKVITSRGNVFYSASGTLTYSDGTWISPSLGVCVNIVNIIGRYIIHVESLTEGVVYNKWYNEDGTGMDFGDVIQTFLLPDDYLAQYQITITKKVGGNWVNLPDTPVSITMDWPYGSPLKYVFANGI